MNVVVIPLSYEDEESECVQLNITCATWCMRKTIDCTFINRHCLQLVSSSLFSSYNNLRSSVHNHVFITTQTVVTEDPLWSPSHCM